MKHDGNKIQKFPNNLVKNANILQLKLKNYMFLRKMFFEETIKNLK